MNKQSKIEKLIAELCPKGVEFKELGKCSSIKRGKRVTKSKLSSEKKYPVYSGGVTPMGYFEKYNQSANTLTVVKYGTAGFVNFITEVFWANDVCYCIKPDDILNNKYLFFVLKNKQDFIQSQATNAIPAHLPTEAIEKIKIPLPPLAVQEEIVKILDNFTALEAELEAELETRKKQYEYYRLALLNAGGNVKQITLNEVGKISMCKRIFKNETLISGDVPFYKIGTFGKQPNAFISQDVYDEYREKFSFPKKGDVLLSASGTIGRRVIYNGEPAYFQDSNIIWIDNDESKVLNKYLYYLYAIIEWNTEGGTIQRLYNDNLKKIKIAIPSLLEQNRIVNILDKFDALVNDISIGLPAELKARRQQYEYYRGKLLTFNEVG